MALSYKTYEQYALVICAEKGIYVFSSDNRFFRDKLREELFQFVASFFDMKSIGNIKMATKTNDAYFKQFLKKHNW